MSLINVLREEAKSGANGRYERLVRYVAERARNDDDAIPWNAFVSQGSEGRSYQFVTQLDGFAALAGGEGPDAMIRRLFGEADGEALLQALGECTESEANIVLQPREDLGGAVLQAETPPSLAVVTRIRAHRGRRRGL